MNWPAIISSSMIMGLLVALWLLYEQRKHIEKLDNIINLRWADIVKLNQEREALRSKIHNLESTIAESEELMQKYDSAIETLQKLRNHIQ